MYTNRIVRLSFGLPGAAFVVFGLYQFMTAIIDADFVPPEDSARGVITAIPLPSEQEAESVPRETRPDKHKLADRPPPPPAYSATASDINLPTPAFDGAVPDVTHIGRLLVEDVTPVAIPNRRVEPLTPPSIAYPRSLASKGVEGLCEVQFDVSPKGKPYNVDASCSHPGFAREAENAVRRVRFAPEIIDGQARARRNVVYPIEFKLDET
ncbi:energy transducer TonB [Henriciella sp.]|uniref:energy transducer TonB n=1 Tax=Henriciella sp. TaxID=1968823 RepID=UPI0026098ACB|nr:energy transducer TonB [Henriciella sp.]